MATDFEKLIVSLEARTNAFEKAMKRAVGQADQNARKIEKRFAGINFGKDVFGPFARGALLALAPVLSIAAAVRGAKEALKEFGDIADQSFASGLDPELFQSLAYQFQQVGVEVGQTAAALATFAKNSGLAVEGKGRMTAALKALDAELLENIRSARNQEERVRLIADALNATVDPAKRAAIATAAFGEAGIKMAAAFANGSSSIDETMVKAKQLGLIVDRELIARADELGDEFDTTARIVDLKLKQAFVNLGPILIWLTGLAGDFAGQIGATIDGLNALSSQATSTLEGRLKGINAQIAAGQGMSLNEAQVAPISPEAGAAEQAAIMAELRKRAIDNLRTQLTSQPPVSEDLPTLEEIEEEGRSHAAAASAAVKHGEAVKGLIADLQFEGEQIGRTALQQDIMNQLRQVGVDVMSEEGQQIAALITNNDALRTSMERNAEIMEEFGAAGLDAITSVIEAFEDGKIEASEFGDILIAALAAAANIYLPGSGQIVSALGGLFKGKRAAGGPVSPGGAYLVGERGPELFAPRVPGNIVPNGKFGGGRVSIVQHYTIGGTITDKDIARTIQQSQSQTVRAIKAAFPSMMVDSQMRAL